MPTPKIPGGIAAIVHKIDSAGAVKIRPFSDLHIGDQHCNYKLISDLVSTIKSDRDTYTFLAGDLINAAIVGAKSDTYKETMTPQEELDKCAEILQPIREKILAIVPGNHEERITKQTGIDVTKTLADRLGIGDRYKTEAALVLLQFGRKDASKYHMVTYSFYVNHGHGGGRRPGGKLNGLSDLASVIDADIIIQGHTHQPGLFRHVSYRICASKRVAVPHEQIMINLPAALTYGGYGMRAGYMPTSSTYPEIILSDTEHKIEVKF